MSDASSVSSEIAACYDASASDIDSGNSEMELSSNESAVWSPTIQPTYSDSGSVNEEKVPRLDKYLKSRGVEELTTATKTVGQRNADNYQQAKFGDQRDSVGYMKDVADDMADLDKVVATEAISIHTATPFNRETKRVSFCTMSHFLFV